MWVSCRACWALQRHQRGPAATSENARQSDPAAERLAARGDLAGRGLSPACADGRATLLVASSCIAQRRHLDDGPPPPVRDRSPMWLVALAGCAMRSISSTAPRGCWARRSRSPRRRCSRRRSSGGALLLDWRRPVGVVVLLVLGGGVLWSNALAYHDVLLAPRSRLAELQHIGGLRRRQGPDADRRLRSVCRPPLPPSTAPGGAGGVPLGDPAAARRRDLDEERVGGPGLLRAGDARTVSLDRDRPIPGAESPALALQPRLAGALLRTVAASRAADVTADRPCSLRGIEQAALLRCRPEPPRRDGPAVLRQPRGDAAVRADRKSRGHGLPRARRPGGLPAPTADRGAWRSDALAGAWTHDSASRTLWPNTPGTAVAQINVYGNQKYELWFGGSFSRGLEVSVDGRVVGRVKDELLEHRRATRRWPRCI